MQFLGDIHGARDLNFVFPLGDFHGCLFIDDDGRPAVDANLGGDSRMIDEINRSPPPNRFIVQRPDHAPPAAKTAYRAHDRAAGENSREFVNSRLNQDRFPAGSRLSRPARRAFRLPLRRAKPESP